MVHYQETLGSVRNTGAQAASCVHFLKCYLRPLAGGAVRSLVTSSLFGFVPPSVWIYPGPGTTGTVIVGIATVTESPRPLRPTDTSAESLAALSARRRRLWGPPLLRPPPGE
eukprot:752849-Prorocentrum_minimum.AAC.2